ncbi:preprotein translocase, secretion protein SecA [Legionella moravica]|uniref:Preprotein translocase, secretion protein SecA n=1 Tax=Legionella moravica TaxID=39962 RepID=A0A378JSR0_9GAMM|nr:DEAD/DEAH box helicase [Legionella moravica]KTD37618.1 preprotein translocase, secretion protein SecA [Legionella moravica]STX61683.1 preprotein translocase, secretion protein SecA [Legionella moravica]HEN5529735.1 hypothetical protein [Legionella pneumophila]
MITPAACPDKPVLGLVDYSKFKLESSTCVATLFSQHQSAWDAFCRHVDSSELNNTNRLMLMKIAFDCLHEHCNTSDLAKLLTLGKYLKDNVGTQLFFMLFSKRVTPESRRLEHYIAACQLLIDLQETSGLTNLVKQSMPNLTLLVQRLEEKQATYLAEKYPSRDIHETIVRFGENSFIEFPLSREELTHLKAEYIAINPWFAFLQKRSSTDLKEKALQSAEIWNERKEIEHHRRLIAIIAELIRRHYNIFPHDTQMLAFMALLNTPEHLLKGRIAQINTGEGKSTIIAMLAAYFACFDPAVYVITPTSYLAIRDQEKYQPFFNSLGFKSTNICTESPKVEQFKANIIYGTNTDFEFAMLRNSLYCLGLNDGKYTAIIDEVDNLFLDAALNSAILAIPGTEDRSWIYQPILSFANNSSSSAPVAELKNFMQSTLSPAYLEQLQQINDRQLSRWLRSAREALFTKHIDRDYLVKELSTGPDIVIVDFNNTGRLNEGCHWQNGLHQFLQAKHGLKITPESLSVASLSHPTYFTQFRRIIGLTGTMGQIVEREEIQRIYNVGSFDVPPHYPSMRKKLPAYFAKTPDEQYDRILEHARAMRSEGRPMLVLVKTIAESVKLNTFFVNTGITPQLINLTQREDEDYLIGQAGEPGTITIATNAAGRGTDIILALNSKLAGGLRFIFGFYPKNPRVEGQGDGRAGRQGQPGDCQMILCEQDDYIIFLRRWATANPGEYSERIAAWEQLNADEKLSTLNSIRASFIKTESDQRYVLCQKEAIYFEKLEGFFTRNQRLYHALQNESLLKSLTQTCESALQRPLSEPTVHLNTLLKGFEPLQETIDTLLMSQIHNIKVDWSVLLKQYKELYMEQFQKTWAEFYDALHKENDQASLEIIRQTTDSKYQAVDQVLKIMDVNPNESISKILQILLSASLRRLLETGHCSFDFSVGSSSSPPSIVSSSSSTFSPRKITVVNMGVNESLPFKLTKGFSGAEKTHRWTDGNEAVLTIPISMENNTISHIIFHTTALISNKITQKLIISGKGLETKIYEYNTSRPEQQIIIDIPAELNDDMDIHFSMPNACKPCEVDPSNRDPRSLAIAFKTAIISVTVQPQKKIQTSPVVQLGLFSSSDTRTLTTAIEALEAADRSEKRRLLAAAYRSRAKEYESFNAFDLAQKDLVSASNICNELISEGMAFYNQTPRDFNNALKSFQAVVTLNTNDKAAWWYIGQCYASLPSIASYQELSFKAFNQATTIDPEYFNAQNCKGVMLVNLGRHQEAIPVLLKAASLNKDFAHTYYYLSIAFKAQGDIPKAYETMNTAAELLPASYATARDNLKTLLDETNRLSLEEGASLQI